MKILPISLAFALSLTTGVSQADPIPLSITHPQGIGYDIDVHSLTEGKHKITCQVVASDAGNISVQFKQPFLEKIKVNGTLVNRGENARLNKGENTIEMDDVLKWNNGFNVQYVQNSGSFSYFINSCSAEEIQSLSNEEKPEGAQPSPDNGGSAGQPSAPPSTVTTTPDSIIMTHPTNP